MADNGTAKRPVKGGAANKGGGRMSKEKRNKDIKEWFRVAMRGK